MTNQELYEKRASLIADARSILDAADAEGRELTSEQREQVDNMLDDSDAIKADVDQRIRLQKCGEMLEEVEARKSALAIAQPQKKEGARGIRSEEYSNAFWQYLRDGELSLTPEQRAVMVEGTNTVGGFAAPMFDFGQATLQDMIIETMDAAYNFQEYATRITIGGEINVPVQNAVGDATWTAENADATEAETTFTQLKFSPYKATRIVQISRELLADSYVDMASDGALTAAGTDEVTWSELQSLYYSLKEPYRKNGTWMFNSTTAAEIRNLTIGDAGYIWQPSGQLGQPDLLLGRPVAINDDCEASTTGNKPILFGDLSYYWITWREGMDFQRLDELFAVAGNIGLRSELRVDGKLTSGEAVKHIIMA